MDCPEDHVVVDLAVIARDLETIASTWNKMQELNVQPDMLAHRLPKDFPVRFEDAAERVIAYIADSSKDQTPMEGIDPALIQQGYELVKSGAVTPMAF